MKGDTFSESFEKHTLLWIGLFTFIITTILGIIGLVVMFIKIHKTNNSNSSDKIENDKELTNKLVINSE